MAITTTYTPANYEYVSLVSDELEEVVPATIDAELEQPGSNSCHRFTIFNGSYLGVSRKGKCHEPRAYWINLAFLDPTPVRHVGQFWSMTTIVLAMVTAAALVTKYSQPAIPVPLLSAGAVAVLCAATVATFVLALRPSYDRISFCTRHGRSPVLSLAAGRPDRRRVQLFIRRIQAAIDHANAERCDDARTHFLRDEMKEHRRLQNAGVLDERQFLIARRLILEAHD